MENPIAVAAAPAEKPPQPPPRGPGRPPKNPKPPEAVRLDKLERNHAELETKVQTLGEWFEDLLPACFKSQDNRDKAEKGFFDGLFD